MKKIYWKTNITLLVSFVAIAYVIYYPSLLNLKFFWDDEKFIFLNPAVYQAPSWYSFWQFNSPSYRSWPLGYAVFWSLLKIPGATIFFFKCINIFFHGLNTFLVEKILRKFKIKYSYLLAMLFLLHPLQVETVSWIFQLFTILATSFFLVSFLYSMKFFETDQRRYYFISLVCFLLSLWTKSILILAPFLIVFLAWYYQKSLKKFLWIIPFFLLSAYAALVTIKGTEAGVKNSKTNIKTEQVQVIKDVIEMAKSSVPIAAQPAVDNSYYEYIFNRVELTNEEKNYHFDRLKVFKQSSWYYFSKLIFPNELLFVYPKFDVPLGYSIAAVFILIALPVILYLRFRKREILFIPFGSFVFIFPFIGASFIAYYLWSNVSDHYAYPFVILLPFSLGLLFNYVGKKKAFTVISALLFFYLYLNIQYSVVFNSYERLYTKILLQNKHPRIYSALFQEYMEQVNPLKAEEVYKEVERLFPELNSTKEMKSKLDALKKNF